MKANSTSVAGNPLPERWAERLLAWYRTNRRDMPWRGNPDPYAVWISEIMLQQTQVDTVRPYFLRFLQAFPTIADLAAAEDDPLLKAWEGLGYYTRVRNLRKAAQVLTAEYCGNLPHTAEELRKLPGIGPYTAAAIASICFGEPTPVVDGNVMRVFARRRALTDDFSKEAPRRALAEWLTPHIRASGSPADFNQAMMELGALVCTPAKPQCATCPIREACKAAEAGTPTAFPIPPKKKTLPERKDTVLILQSPSGALLLSRHTGERLLAGFLELPTVESLKFLMLRNPSKCFVYRQTFSHFRLIRTVKTAETDFPKILPEGFTLCDAPEKVPLTTATRKILAKFQTAAR